jgi:hypothetical protein
MNDLKIKINGIKYLSLGRYLDNNDGIYFYFPKSHNIRDWESLLNNESLLIRLWIIGNMNFCLFNDCLECYPKIMIDKIQKKNNLINDFVRKYFDDDGVALNEIFEDFIFGRFSEYSSGLEIIENELSNIQLTGSRIYKYEEVTYNISFEDIFSNETLTNDFDIRDIVFIRDDFFNILSIDLNNIIAKLFN